MLEGKYVMRSICQKDGTVVQEPVVVPPFQVPQRVGEDSFESPTHRLSRGNAIDRAKKALNHYLINHLISTMLSGQCFVFLFCQGTE